MYSVLLLHDCIRVELKKCKSKHDKNRFLTNMSVTLYWATGIPGLSMHCCNGLLECNYPQDIASYHKLFVVSYLGEHQACLTLTLIAGTHVLHYTY